MRTRKTALKKNSRGWIPKEVGYLDRAKRRQPKFNLGTNEKEAEKRLARIQELFDDCQRHTGLPVWTNFGLYAAKLIAKGIYQIPLPFDRDWEEEVQGQETLEDICANYVQRLRAEQACYPSIQIVPTDEDVYAYGVRLRESSQRLDAAEWKLRLALEATAMMWVISGFVLGLGSVLSILGFGLWWYKVQRYQDRILQADALARNNTAARVPGRRVSKLPPAIGGRRAIRSRLK